MLYKILTDRRKSIGMSIDQLVEKSGVPKGTVTKVLTGISPNPALETVKAIAYALGLTLNDLMEESNPSFSKDAMRIALAYDSMSDYGKEIIRCVIDQEKKFRVMRAVPILGEAVMDGSVETKEAARREQNELTLEEKIESFEE